MPGLVGPGEGPASPGIRPPSSTLAVRSWRVTRGSASYKRAYRSRSLLRRTAATGPRDPGSDVRGSRLRPESRPNRQQGPGAREVAGRLPGTLDLGVGPAEDQWEEPVTRAEPRAPELAPMFVTSASLSPSGFSGGRHVSGRPEARATLTALATRVTPSHARTREGSSPSKRSRAGPNAHTGALPAAYTPRVTTAPRLSLLRLDAAGRGKKPARSPARGGPRMHGTVPETEGRTDKPLIAARVRGLVTGTASVYGPSRL